MHKCKSTRFMPIFRQGYLATVTRPRLHTLYDVLQIGVNSSFNEIRWAFIELSKQFHPDACKTPPRRHAADEFIKICEAYKTLSKPKARSLYDEKLKAQRDLHVPLDLGDWQPNLQRRWEKYQAEMRKKQVVVKILKSGVLTAPQRKAGALAARGTPERNTQLAVLPRVAPDDDDGGTRGLWLLLRDIWCQTLGMRTHWNGWASLITTGFSFITLHALCSLLKDLKKARPM